ncbi:MAG: thiamine pyrophosphate-dependent dehydrogenase E1 component subunit alpha [Actinobacteria bacterium]|nr:thiamine pyrophosphate-dependent dehydrogenase E1 component subunit alpha [Actinomycetota bacterium]
MKDIASKLKLYKKMVLIREFENCALDLYSKNLIKGSIHTYIGQEAIAVGVCSNLNSKIGDCITTTHRGHGHVIAMGGDIKAMMAELLGKETGICQGRSGSMHIADISKGIYGANGIVGAGIPIATGLAFSARYDGKNFVSVTFFGDGASNQGVLYESLNLAAIWNLPVIFVCENNKYAQTTPAKDTIAGKDIKSRAESFGIESVKIDGNNVEEVYEEFKRVIDLIRKEKRPFFVEALTYRFKGHWQGDPEVYRGRDEIKKWINERCPIKNFKTKLIGKYNVSSEKINNLEKQVKHIIEQAKDFAISSKEPENNLLDNIYDNEVIS